MAITTVDTTYYTPVQLRDGGYNLVIASGGGLGIQSGASMGVLPGGTLTIASGATITWGGELEIQADGRLEILASGNLEIDATASAYLDGSMYVGPNGLFAFLSGASMIFASGTNIAVSGGASMYMNGAVNGGASSVWTIVSGANINLASGTSMTTIGSFTIMSSGLLNVQSGANIDVSGGASMVFQSSASFHAEEGANITFGPNVTTGEVLGYQQLSWMTYDTLTSGDMAGAIMSYGFGIIQLASGTSTGAWLLPSAAAQGAFVYVAGHGIMDGASGAISQVAGVSMAMMNTAGVVSGTSTIGFNSSTDFCRFLGLNNTGDWMILEGTADINFG